MTGRRYRTKLELLRDVLSAVQSEPVKTRIMNRANLNQVSFARYVTLCKENQLLVEVSGGFTLTPHAEEILQSLNQVLSRMAELRVAVDVLNRTARSGGYRIVRTEVGARSGDHIRLPELLAQAPQVDRRPQVLRQG